MSPWLFQICTNSFMKFKNFNVVVEHGAVVMTASSKSGDLSWMPTGSQE